MSRQNVIRLITLVLVLGLVVVMFSFLRACREANDPPGGTEEVPQEQQDDGASGEGSDEGGDL